SFFVFGNYVDGDVIVNEFMYDPPGEQDEYVELKNTSNKFLNLRNWIIGDDSHLAVISSHSVILRPDSFLVISSDTSTLFNVFGKRAYVQSSGMPALNNSGDEVRIFTTDSVRVDSLQYTSAWGGSKVALER